MASRRLCRARGRDGQQCPHPALKGANVCRYHGGANPVPKATKRTPARRLPTWKVAGLAFIAMCVQDVLGTAMVIFESRFNAADAAAMDFLGYLATLLCSALALDSILKDGWRSRRSLIIIASVSAANIAGTVLGVHVGKLLT